MNEFVDIEERLASLQLSLDDVGVCEHAGEVRANDIFVARRGASSHGLRFLPEALERGASVVVYQEDDGTEELVAGLDDLARQRLVAVQDLDVLAVSIADRLYKENIQQLRIIGITGTNGKTSTAMFMSSLMRSMGEKVGYIGTAGYGVIGEQLQGSRNTTPEYVSLLRYLNELRQTGCDAIVMEVSSHALSLGRVKGLVFDIAVLTNISRDHLDFHGDMESYVDAKASLFRQDRCRMAVINVGDAYGARLVQRLSGPGMKLVVYGGSASMDIPGSAVGVRLSSHEFAGPAKQVLGVETDDARVEAVLNLPGAFNAENCLAALASCVAAGYSLEELVPHVPAIRPVAGRLQEAVAGLEPRVYLDYAHTPDGVSKVLSDLAASHAQGRLWCVMGCGGQRDIGKRVDMGAAGKALSDTLVITDDNPRAEPAEQIIIDMLRGIADRKGLVICRDRMRAAAYVSASSQADDLVVFLGKGDEAVVDYGKDKIMRSDLDIVSASF